MFIIFITVYLVDIVWEWCIIGSMKTNDTTHTPMPTKLSQMQGSDQKVVDALNELFADIVHHIDKKPDYTLTESEIKWIFDERIRQHSKFLDIKCPTCAGKNKNIRFCKQHEKCVGFDQKEKVTA
tara:strand:- start:43 stop:417 length:375 start_codon:yes stop_codon:yes gene_type:complete